MSRSFGLMGTQATPLPLRAHLDTEAHVRPPSDASLTPYARSPTFAYAPLRSPTRFSQLGEDKIMPFVFDCGLVVHVIYCSKAWLVERPTVCLVVGSISRRPTDRPTGRSAIHVISCWMFSCIARLNEGRRMLEQSLCLRSGNYIKR